MPIIWCAISGHGFGHAAQVVPVLNALGGLVPGLTAILRTTVPASFFQDRLTIPWELSPAQQDIGCIQDGPLTIDVDATWAAHQHFHETWNARLANEVAAMQAASPALIIADTPYLAIEAGSCAHIPTVALASFTWDLVLKEYCHAADQSQQQLIQHIRESYSKADRALRITPAPTIDAFSSIIDIGPIASPYPPERNRLASALNLAPNEKTVLVGFGGIPLTSLPLEYIEGLSRYRFLCDGPIPPGYSRIHSIKTLPFSFKTLLASVDLIMTKPGYGTIVEAIALQQPVLYVRRYNFVDEQPLVDYLHRYGRGMELSLDDFVKGRWEDALRTVLDLPTSITPQPSATGAADAATILAKSL
jgi:UDP:flavonoid glycosyltransferase YjiC (YdhE family)